MGCPVILRRWYKDISFTPEEPKTIQAWVKLYGIPNDLTHVPRIRFVASRFTRPCLTDVVSAKQGCLDFTHICIKLDACKGICREANFYKSIGVPYKVKAKYEWIPLHYPTCCIFGNSTVSCPARKPTTKAVVSTNHKNPERCDNEK